ncbi:MAG: patatin-like phospholipase family protein [Actinomycetia bacterium]|nr:patatin-like phospholipase family protein [Actinomycetes bacterium]
MVSRATKLRNRLAAVTAHLPGRAKTAFILSGGGSLGAVQVGMLRALFEAGILPDLILGCSVGSINGAGYAADPTLRGVARLERIWRRLAAGDPDLMPGGRIPLAVQLARKGEALHDPTPLENLLADELPVDYFSDLRVPFQCVATDLETASEHWFDSGPIVPALMASASLPAVYPAREIGGRSFIDGGVLNEIHALRAVELGASRLYVLHVGHLDNREMTVQRPFDGAMRAYWTHRRFRLESDLGRVPSHCTIHRLPAGATPRLRFDDFTKGPELSDLAYRQTTEFLQTGSVVETADEQELASGPHETTWPISGSGGGERTSEDREGPPVEGSDGASQ